VSLVRVELEKQLAKNFLSHHHLINLIRILSFLIIYPLFGGIDGANGSLSANN
jgi:hypothetical protein